MEISESTPLNEIIAAFGFDHWSWVDNDDEKKTIEQICKESAAVAMRDVLPDQQLRAAEQGIYIKTFVDTAIDVNLKLFAWDALFDDCIDCLCDQAMGKTEALKIADILEAAAKDFRVAAVDMDD